MCVKRWQWNLYMTIWQITAHNYSEFKLLIELYHFITTVSRYILYVELLYFIHIDWNVLKWIGLDWIGFSRIRPETD